MTIIWIRNPHSIITPYFSIVACNSHRLKTAKKLEKLDVFAFFIIYLGTKDLRLLRIVMDWSCISYTLQHKMHKPVNFFTRVKVKIKICLLLLFSSMFNKYCIIKYTVYLKSAIGVNVVVEINRLSI